LVFLVLIFILAW